MKSKKLSLLRVLVLAVIFLFSPSYIDYEELIEVDFISSRMRFEDRDIEDFSFDKQLNFTIGLSFLSVYSPLGNNFFDSSTGIYLQIPPLAQDPFILRC